MLDSLPGHQQIIYPNPRAWKSFVQNLEQEGINDMFLFRSQRCSSFVVCRLMRSCCRHSNSVECVSLLAYYWWFWSAKAAHAGSCLAVLCACVTQDETPHLRSQMAWKEYGPKWLCISISHTHMCIRGPWCLFLVVFLMRLSLCFHFVVPPMTGLTGWFAAPTKRSRSLLLKCPSFAQIWSSCLHHCLHVLIPKCDQAPGAGLNYR